VKLVLSRFSDPSLPKGYLKSGTYIDIFERLPVFLLLLIKQAPLIGFVITAKAIYRYGDLNGSNEEKMKLSEYFIIGTFASLLWALTVFIVFQPFLSL